MSCQCSAESPMVALKHSPVSHPRSPAATAIAAPRAPGPVGALASRRRSHASSAGAPPDSSALSTNCWPRRRATTSASPPRRSKLPWWRHCGQPRRGRPLKRPGDSDSHRRGGRAQAKSDFRLQSINGSTIFSGPLLRFHFDLPLCLPRNKFVRKLHPFRLMLPIPWKMRFESMTMHLYCGQCCRAMVLYSVQRRAMIPRAAQRYRARSCLLCSGSATALCSGTARRALA